ncbi:MAG: alpha/beta hydrolase [Devosia sp.]
MTTTANKLDLDLAPAASRRARFSFRWIARPAGRALVGIALLAATGAAYEAIAGIGDTVSQPPAGRFVDVGGYKLHLDCRGEGAGTVVLDAGLGGSSLDWVLVQSSLAATSRVCSYDRAGMGWSEPGPQPRSPSQLARELHTLLENAGVPGPYVLVAHSLAGKTVRLFAADHPADVGGIVLVDARSEQVDAVDDFAAFAASLNSTAMLYSVARRLGIVRLLGGNLVGEPLVPPDLATRLALAQTAPNAIAATTQEGLARSADDAALTGETLGSMPLVVIAAEDSMSNIPNWPAAQAAMAALSSNGRLIVARDSGHAIQFARPDLVVDAALSVLADVRKHI